MRNRKEKINLKVFFVIFIITLFYIFLLSSFPIKNKICCMYGSSRYHGPLLEISKVVDDYEIAKYVYKYSTPKLLSMGYTVLINWITVIINLFLSLTISSFIYPIITNNIYKKKNFWIYAIIVGIILTILLHLFFRFTLFNWGQYIAG